MTVARSPKWHYDEANRLLASFTDDDMGLPFARARIAKAHVHALLAQCPAEYANGYTPYPRTETRAPTGGRL